MKILYLDSHKSFCKFSLTFIIKEISYYNLCYKDFKFDKWTFKLLFSMNKRVNKKTHNLKYKK
jgi:hypothetical protein